MRNVFAILLLTSLSAAAADDIPSTERLDIRKPSIQWEPLPPGVQWVLTSPDGRTWCQCGLNRYQGGPTVPEIQKRIEEEFKRPRPQLSDAGLLLLEPGGRVWVYARSGNALLGYDGREWITRAVEDPKMHPVGRCTTRGGLIDANVHRFTGGIAWFIARGGIHRFDGKEWSFQALTDDERMCLHRTMLSVSTDGRTAVAHLQHTSSIWVFHDGTWTEHEVFADPKNAVVEHLAIDGSRTIWYVLRRGRLRHWTLDGDGRIVPPETPEKAAEEQARSDEAPAAFGSARVAKVRALFQNETGGVYAVADAVDDAEEKMAESDATEENGASGRPIEPGVVFLQPDGQTRILPGRRHAPLWVPSSYSTPPPVVDESGKRIWLPGGSRAGTPVLLDVDRGEIVDRLPHHGYACLQTVVDGSVFVSRGTAERFDVVVMAYTPSAPKPERFESLDKEIGDQRVVIGGDGAVWAVDSLGRLIRFDDGDWKVMQPQSRTRLGTMLPGHGSVMLVERGGEWTLFHDGRDADHGSLLGLVERHRELIGKAFTPGCPPPDPQKAFLIAGPDGLMWYLNNGALRLSEGNRWYDATGPLLKAGSRGGHVAWAVAIDDGRKVYVSDFNLIHDGGKSFVVGLGEDGLQVEPAPHVCGMNHGEDRRYLGIRDTAAGLWLPGSRSGSGGTCDIIYAQVAVRLTANGIAGKWENHGWARLVDASGHVWLGSIRGKRSAEFNLWRNGEFVQQLSIPGYERSLIFSDRPGSVYAHTSAGLHHLVADPPDFARYRLDKLYALPETLAGGVSIAYSKQGYVVFLSSGRPGSAAVHLVKLPVEDGEGDQ